MQPQVIVTLSPAGDLIAELPSLNGTRRQVPLSRDTTSISCEATLLRMLEAQLRNEIAIGLDGAPTCHQVRHWEQHAIWRNPSCPFCKAELRQEQRRRPKAKLRETVGDGSVVVRTLTRQGKARATRMQAEELF